MKKILCTIGILAILVSVACEDRDDNLMAPQVRIQNLSDFDFVRVQVRNDSIVYENVAAGGFSDYLEYEIAYQQDAIAVETDSTQFSFMPDSLSDPLPLGLYTYQLDISENGELELTFKVD
ncbi:MAG: hypothetical protein CMH48_12245 [Muricauda sp.]|nr:hypothetical protein [Allomuricauda sp.]MBC31602.1 hypothetical protein [Allomuricauda sp.]|tara:strand:- start:15740 stop:16102 length:363 start_codon:yes stop_codon:yes gene_type:complete